MLDILKEKGIPLEKQQFTWRDMVQVPISKVNGDWKISELTLLTTS